MAWRPYRIDISVSPRRYYNYERNSVNLCLNRCFTVWVAFSFILREVFERIAIAASLMSHQLGRKHDQQCATPTVVLVNASCVLLRALKVILRGPDDPENLFCHKQQKGKQEGRGH